MSYVTNRCSLKSSKNDKSLKIRLELVAIEHCESSTCTKPTYPRDNTVQASFHFVASLPALCTRTHYKHFCCLCPTLMYNDPLQALLLLLSYPYVQGPTTSTSAASVLPLCTRTHYKHFCCLCPTFMYKDPLQALLLPLSYLYVQGPTTSTSAASVLPLCTRTHYKHFCCFCPTLMYRDPLQALLLPLSYPYVQGPTTSTSAASVLPLCSTLLLTASFTSTHPSTLP